MTFFILFFFALGVIVGIMFFKIHTRKTQKELQQDINLKEIPPAKRNFVANVMKAARENKYNFLELQSNNKMISFIKFLDNQSKVRINVYYTTRTVGTCLDHPKRGKTQLFRGGCDLSAISEIFKNPRIHTKKGYYKT